MDKLKDVLDFNKRERVGLILLSCVSIALYLFKMNLVPDLLKKEVHQNMIAQIEFETAVLLHEERDTVALYTFDPNQVDEADLKNFGLDRYAIKSWLGYLNKGYKFWKEEDVKKIYGLKEEDFHRLLPFMQIKHETRKNKSQDWSSKKYENKAAKKKQRKVDINTANAEDFKQLKGIGDKRAKTIIKFRTALNGFHSVEQIKEVYGIDSSLFAQLEPYLSLDPSQFKRMNVFTLSADSLQTHRFINYRAAHAIKRYIRNNPEQTVIDPETIRSLDGVDAKYMDKALPYLVLRKY